MAVLIIALFVIVVVWGWYLVPKKTGAHKSSTLNVRGRQITSRSQRSASRSVPGATVVPVAGAANPRVTPVPARVGSGASTRRRRIRTGLVIAVVLSIAAALYTGSSNWWWVHLAMDALLIIYYGLSMQIRENRAAQIAPTVSRFQEESRSGLRKVVGG